MTFCISLEVCVSWDWLSSGKVSLFVGLFYSIQVLKIFPLDFTSSPINDLIGSNHSGLIPCTLFFQAQQEAFQILCSKAWFKIAHTMKSKLPIARLIQPIFPLIACHSHIPILLTRHAILIHCSQNWPVHHTISLSFLKFFLPCGMLCLFLPYYILKSYYLHNSKCFYNPFANIYPFPQSQLPLFICYYLILNFNSFFFFA